MNILLDSKCPRCERTATMELKANVAIHDPQKLDVIVECHFCNTAFNKFISIDEMVASDE